MNRVGIPSEYETSKESTSSLLLFTPFMYPKQPCAFLRAKDPIDESEVSSPSNRRQCLCGE